MNPRTLEDFHENRARPTVRISFIEPWVGGDHVVTVGELDTVGEAGHDSVYDVVHLTLREEGRGTTGLLIPIIGIHSWDVMADDEPHMYVSAPAF